MKYVFSANRVSGFSESNPNLGGLLSLIFENIEWAGRFAKTEFYCNPGIVLDTAIEYFENKNVRCIEFGDFDHGNFWPWGKFKAIIAAANGMDPEEPLIHLDLDTIIYRCLGDFFRDGAEVLVSGLEVYSGGPVFQSNNETIYSNIGGTDAITTTRFYNEVLEATEGRFSSYGYAYNCCILGGLAKHLKSLCAKIEEDGDLYMKKFVAKDGGMPGAEIEHWKTACVFEQVRIVDFCKDKKVAILPLSPSAWSSRNGNFRAGYDGEGSKDSKYQIKNVKFLGAPTHHHMVLRSSQIIKKEVSDRQIVINAGRFVKDEIHMNQFPPIDYS